MTAPKPGSPESSADPFGTSTLRGVVLAAWSASPARFREDANAEEALTVGYGDRVIAELAANAADAAHAAGRPGSLWIRLVSGVGDHDGGGDRVRVELRAANTGAPLTPDGVAALASLRASAKRTPPAGAASPDAPPAAPTGQVVPSAAPAGGVAPGGAQAGQVVPAASRSGLAAAPVVGHFGVGFTAVRALTDEPSVVSTSGGVRFGVADTLAALSVIDSPRLDAEVAARHGRVPALRLPWPVPPDTTRPPEGFDTEVRLPLREDVDTASLADALNPQTCLDLLWALPDLQSVRLGEHEAIRVEPAAAASESGSGRSGAGTNAAADVNPADPDLILLDGAPRRFRVATASGRLPAALLVDRPVEERTRDAWRLSWVLPLDDANRPDPPAQTMVGAPIPTDEPLTLPAALVGTLPVDDTRRHLGGGPLADHLVARAAEAYLDLALSCPPEHRPWLIPSPGFPAGPFDHRMRDAVLGVLRGSRFLVAADGVAVAPGNARVLPGLRIPAAALLADVIPGLVGWPESGSRLAERWRAVGVHTLALGEVTAALAGVDRPVAFWREVYDALAESLSATGAESDDLADLPIPRQGGGTIIGTRGVLVVEPQDAAGAAPSLLARAAALIPGLRLAAEGVGHPLLDRLGAVPATASAILADPLTGAEIRRRREDLEEFDPDHDDVLVFGDLIADLVAEAGSGGSAAESSLSGLLLTDADGEPWPAGELLLPGAALARVLADDADLPTVGDRWVDRHGAAVLERIGVRAGFAVVAVAVPPDPQLPIDGLLDWWERVGSGAGPVDSVEVIADLDLVDESSWPAALAMIAADRRTRDALRSNGSVPTYAAWWIANSARFGGRFPAEWRTADASELAGLFDVFPVDIAREVAADVGVLTDLANAVTRSPAELIARWADPARRVVPAAVPALTAAVVDTVAADPELDLPDAVRTVDGSVADPDRAVVLDLPWLAQVVPPGLAVPGGPDPERAAAMLALDPASEAVVTAVEAGPKTARRLVDSPDAARCLEFFGLTDLVDVTVLVVPDLTVEATIGAGGSDRHRVSWWSEGGRILVDGSAAGLGRAIAHLAGRWADRHAFVAITAGDRAEPAEAAFVGSHPGGDRPDPTIQ